MDSTKLLGKNRSYNEKQAMNWDTGRFYQIHLGEIEDKYEAGMANL